MRISPVVVVAGISAFAAVSLGGTKDFSIMDAHIIRAPYVWKCTVDATSARAEANMPGAYLKMAVRNTDSVGLLVDGVVNAGVLAERMPILDCSIDGGEFVSHRLLVNSGVYTLPIGAGLDPTVEHSVDIFFRASDLGGRWVSTGPDVCIAGIQLSKDGELLSRVRLPRTAIAFGDSITEGVLAEGSGPYYADLQMNDARATWVPIVCAALQAEYGQLGTGGQGMVKPIQIPPLFQTWDRYDPATSRLIDGHLRPEPDYVFCFMGTNDSVMVKPGLLEKNAWRSIDIRPEYAKWLAAARKACPDSLIFCITPPFGLHAGEIAEVVMDRRKAGDEHVFLIDTTILRDRFIPIRFEPGSDFYTLEKTSATQFASDGVHPSLYGNAMLGALIAVEATRHLPVTP